MTRQSKEGTQHAPKTLELMAIQSLTTPKQRPNQAGHSPYHSVRASGRLLDDVYALRYDAYSAQDYIDKNDSERFRDKYDGMRNCSSFLTYSNARPIGSIRICAYRPSCGLPVPVMENFNKELFSRIGSDTPFAEINRFVVHPDFQRRGGVRARFSIYKNVIDQIDQLQTECVVAAVREEHLRFYKMLNFEPISPLKPYPGLNFQTVLMVCSDVPRELVLARCSRELAA